MSRIPRGTRAWILGGMVNLKSKVQNSEFGNKNSVDYATPFCLLFTEY
jgi:hypothetical protein